MRRLLCVSFFAYLQNADFPGGGDSRPEQIKPRRMRPKFTVSGFGSGIPVRIGTRAGWETVVTRADQEGQPANTMDAFLDATAELHHFTIVTRNIADFRKLTKSVINPWNELQRLGQTPFLLVLPDNYLAATSVFDYAGFLGIVSRHPWTQRLLLPEALPLPISAPASLHLSVAC